MLRYFSVFGPGQDPASQYAAVVPLFTTAVLTGRRATVFGDGLQSRDFTYVNNVVSANMLAATVPGASGLTSNIGCGFSYTLLDLLGIIETEVGTKLQPVFEPPRPGDVPFSQADIAFASEQLGYRVLVLFEERVRRTVGWYRQRLLWGAAMSDQMR